MNDDTDGDGAIDQKWTYSYSDGGLSETDVDRDLGGNVLETDVIGYDHAGRFVHLSVETPEFFDVIDDTYDTFGRLQTETQDLTGDAPGRWVTTYTAWNDAGSPTAAVTTTTVAGEEGYTTSMSYDDEGRLTEVLETHSDDSIHYQKTVVYDDAAGTRTSTRTTAGGRSYTTVETFVGGHPVEFAYMGGDSNWTITYTWDGDRLVDGETRLSSGALLDAQHYLYNCPSL